MKSQRIIVDQRQGIPPICIRNKEVKRINAAQPFMLMVVQIGNTKRETLLETPNLSSAVCIVTGNVAAELFVNRAINTAGIILPKVRTGFKPLAKRKSGRIMKNWMTLPPPGLQLRICRAMPSQYRQRTGQKVVLQRQ